MNSKKIKIASFIVCISLFATALTACGSKDDAASAKASSTEATQTNGNTSNTVAATVDPQTGTDSMIATSGNLKTSLEGKDEAKVKELTKKIESDWLSFENDVKTKLPDQYVNVEKYLNTLIAGGKQAKLEFDVLTTLNDSLLPALKTLSDTLKSGKGTVNKDSLEASADIQAATKEYAKYVQGQGDELVSGLESLLKEIQGSDLKKSQDQYVKSRLPYERIEPIIELFAELDGTMDARVDDFTSPDDENFTGYHRLEHLLFVKKETKGAVKFAERLLADGKKMREEIAAMKIDPTLFVTGVGELMEEAQSSKITGEEERWSQATLPVVRANVEGAEKIFELLRSELKKKDVSLEEKIDKNLKAVLKQIDEFSPNGVFTPYDKLSQTQQTDLKNKLEALAVPLVKLPGTLGQ
ncbi:EfeM/EfeO family lipoprotein [Paenibacillus sp. N1-5-1-14]|uniref:EfeM/EfeO family lipoprotein n=1 Tax=Paenibacillus radicibacter TaxID=2972488 RepID=UPI0021597279|nr:EfeM/EfeO family lipoprotein [Paenibacillus radicibacter]MCR8645390.1 EfeM/EfeO family lipoprotein [Paenibacillus radicibacter]